VAAAYARLSGAEVRLGTAVTGIAGRVVETTGGPVRTRQLVTCAGLQADRVAALAGVRPPARIVPFRGEYHELARPELVRGLVYPVPDPRFPFLGVHLTRRVDDEVLVGPNAVPALAAEGYRRTDVDLRHVAHVLRWPGFRRLAVRNWQAALRETATTVSKRAFAAAARRYMPDLRTADLIRHAAGVRAQALDRRGHLVDDFIIDSADGLTVVRNAPSPAATSSLAIAEHVVATLTGGPPAPKERT
jgi:(S)-2-hydroxyglutarate dehydrogenase